MLTFTEQQLAPMRAIAFERYGPGIAQYLRRRHPARMAGFDVEQTRRLVAEGIESARVHGITETRALCLYTEALLLLGSGFDRREAWAAEILASRHGAWERARLLAVALSIRRHARAARR